ncbi:hypothetical protein L210DRAFT_3504527 [Boletus edulis BED1]|uniref:Uncharacterized protein n=1 Tax=Boletus edulis BED1 TaxID=1328754 RepID=A0AAD4GEL0_BOLED|nr:hypothetical protein L210DRAFT_3504527 [Boletus edulis BED1]
MVLMFQIAGSLTSTKNWNPLHRTPSLTPIEKTKPSSLVLIIRWTLPSRSRCYQLTYINIAHFQSILYAEANAWTVLAQDCVIALVNDIICNCLSLHSLVNTALVLRIETVTSTITSVIDRHCRAGIQVPSYVPDLGDIASQPGNHGYVFLVVRGVWRCVNQLIYSPDPQISIDPLFSLFHPVASFSPTACHLVDIRMTWNPIPRLPVPAQLCIGEKIAFCLAWIVVGMRAMALSCYTFQAAPLLTTDHVLCVAREHALIRDFFDQVSAKHDERRAALVALCQHSVQQAAHQINKGIGLSPRPSPSAGINSLYVGDLDPSKYRKLEGIRDYTNTLQDGINLLQLLLNTYPSPEALWTEFAEALLRRNAMALALADAEQRYEDWESTLHQILGDKEVQKIFQAHAVIDVDDANTVRGCYVTAITRIKMGNFCLSRKM